MPHSRRTSPARRRVLTLVLPLAAPFIVSLAACAPEYNWRELHADAEGFRVSLPGRPSQQRREINLQGQAVMMSLHSAKVADTTFAVGIIELAPGTADPQRAEALAAMQAQLRRNLGGQEASHQSRQVPVLDRNGNRQAPEVAQWIAVQGQVADHPSTLQGVFVGHGRRVYQAVVLGRRIDPEEGRTFFDSFRLID